VEHPEADAVSQIALCGICRKPMPDAHGHVARDAERVLSVKAVVQVLVEALLEPVHERAVAHQREVEYL
jgi:hypothetical protein